MIVAIAIQSAEAGPSAQAMMIQRVVVIIVERRVVIHLAVVIAAARATTTTARADQVDLGVGAGMMIAATATHRVKDIAPLVNRAAPVLGEVLQISVAVHRRHDIRPGVIAAAVRVVAVALTTCRGGIVACVVTAAELVGAGGLGEARAVDDNILVDLVPFVHLARRVALPVVLADLGSTIGRANATLTQQRVQT